jgi:ATP-binding cassette, subfamily C (CFTR/MRP), member 1
MFEMEFSGCLNDDTLGPPVRGCRDDFDFTLKFEKIFLSMLPSAVFVALSVPRVVLLTRKARVVRGAVFQATKLARSSASPNFHTGWLML